MAKIKLMIVDDESDLLSELKPLLERMGFAVETAANGEQALAVIALSAPDLIVMDVMMPHIDGREVLRRLRAANNWTPIIFRTFAWAAQDGYQWFKSLGFELS